MYLYILKNMSQSILNKGCFQIKRQLRVCFHGISLGRQGDLIAMIKSYAQSLILLTGAIGQDLCNSLHFGLHNCNEVFNSYGYGKQIIF